MSILKIVAIVVGILICIVIGFVFLASWAINTVAREELEEMEGYVGD